MNRRDLVLAILASAEGRSLSPVQLQKAAFLVTRNVDGIISDGDEFHFVPYDYGPFDRAVYDEAATLSMTGLGAIQPSGQGRWNVYSATEEGLARGAELLGRLQPNIREYVVTVTNWVRSQSFSSLVKSIYDRYPEMRANSIFQG